MWFGEDEGGYGKNLTSIQADKEHIHDKINKACDAGSN